MKNLKTKLITASLLTAAGCFSHYAYSFTDLSEKHRNFLFSKETDVFIWGKGNNKSGKGYANFVPHQLTSFQGEQPRNIIDLKFNEHGCVAIDKNKKAYFWTEPILACHKEKGRDDGKREGVVQIGSDVVQSCLTKNKIFLLDSRGKVHMVPLQVTEQPPETMFAHLNKPPEVMPLLGDKVIVKELDNIKQIAAGNDHFICLDKDGKLFGMGDDSYGQLGQGTFSAERRKQMQEYFNFVVRRERLPKAIVLTDKVKKVACGKNHTLILTEEGRVYGCGNNQYEQLSQDEMYVKQIIGLDSPTEIPLNKFEDCRIVDIACSDQCSFFIAKNEANGTFKFFSAGLGLKGTLGQNLTKHISDVEPINDLNSLVNTDTQEPFEPLKLVCGAEHCLLLFKNPRVVYVWGDNEFGELGTKDTLLYDSPFPMLEEFMLPYNILNISAGGRNSAFICEKVDKKRVRQILKKDREEFERELKEIKEKAVIEKEEVEEKAKQSQFWKVIRKYI